jgi:hypothetical protein
MKSQDQQLLEEAYQNIANGSVPAVNAEVKDCHDVIKKLAAGEFKNEPDEIIKRVKQCSNVFSVTQDDNGNYTVIIKDSALPVVQKMYPELTDTFKSAADCKKDVAKCRQDKLS